MTDLVKHKIAKMISNNRRGSGSCDTHIAEIDVQSAPRQLVDQDVRSVSVTETDDVPDETWYLSWWSTSATSI